MNTLLEALAGQADNVFALAIALLIWRLTNRSRDRADRQAEQATFRERFHALVIAVADVRVAADLNQRLRESWWERARFLGLAAWAAAGEDVRVRLLGGSELQAATAAGGRAAELGLREIHANKTALATLHAPMTRAYAAATPFLSHTDERVVETTNELLTAVGDIKNNARFEAALEAFGQAVAAVSQPRPSLWARLRGRTRRQISPTGS